MPEDSEISPKVYCLHEAATLLNLKPHVLRFWEVEFPQLTPIRNDKGLQFYTPASMALLHSIRQLLHEQGMSIEEARQVLTDGAPAAGEVPTALGHAVLEAHCMDSSPVGPVNAAFKVIGIGEAGANAVRNMRTFPLLRQAVTFVCAHTDPSALDGTDAAVKILLGGKAEDDFDSAAWRDVLTGEDMVVVVADLGEYVEKDALLLLARMARELGVLTVCVVTMPVTSDNIAAERESLNILSQNVDSLMPVPASLFQTTHEQMPLGDIQEKNMDAACSAVRSLLAFFAGDGLISVDFGDVQHVLSQSGIGGAGRGVASGKSRAQKAARRALEGLSHGVSLKGVKRAMYNIAASDDVTSEEIQEVGDIIAENLSEDCSSVFSVHPDTENGEALCVSIVASSLCTTWSPPLRPPYPSFMPSSSFRPA